MDLGKDFQGNSVKTGSRVVFVLPDNLYARGMVRCSRRDVEAVTVVRENGEIHVRATETLFVIDHLISGRAS